MPKYTVTEMAGRDVGGKPSPGAGKLIELTKGQAEHPLRLGHVTLPTDHDGDGKKGGVKPKAK